MRVVLVLDAHSIPVATLRPEEVDGLLVATHPHPRCLVVAPLVHGHAAYKRNVDSQRPVDAAAFEAEEDAESDACPLRIRTPTVEARLVSGDSLELLHFSAEVARGVEAGHSGSSGTW